MKLRINEIYCSYNNKEYSLLLLVGGQFGGASAVNLACMSSMCLVQWLCIKVGWGQGDRDMGMRVWGLGTWGRETRDLGTSSMGCRDVKNRDAGDAGCE